MRFTALGSFWQFLAPYAGMIMLPLVAVIIALLKYMLDKLQHLSVKLESVNETAKATKQQTDGIVSRLQDTIARKDVEKDATALQVENDKKLAVAKASDREEPK